MKKWMIGIMAMALTMGFRPDGYVQAQTETDAAFVDEDGDGIDDTDRMRHRMGRRGFLGKGPRLQLDETQRAELKALIDGLRESDSTREEIRTAVEAKLDGWGVERPERGEHRTGPGRFGRRGDFRGFRGPHHGPPPASVGETESSGS